MGFGSANSATVLVVEDEVLLRLSIADKFRARGYTVVEVANADEALSILQSGTVINAVFTDVRMPGSMDGIELVRRICADWPDIGVLVASGSPPAVDLHQIGAAGFFAKPYDPECIIAHIAVLVASGTMAPPRCAISEG
jgi:CheY-like chemotaxis protein